MGVIQILYYIMSAFLIFLIAWQFAREKKNVTDMILYLVIAVPFVLRVLHVK